METEVEVDVITKHRIEAIRIFNILEKDFYSLDCKDNPESRFMPKFSEVDCKGTLFSAQSPDNLSDSWLSMITDALLSNTDFNDIQEIKLKIPSIGYSVSNTVGMDI